jgi:hypothetical protein
MATQATADTEHWLCLRCRREFYDQSGYEPCPHCGNDDGNSIEAVDHLAPAVEKARSVTKPKAKHAVTSKALTSGKSQARKGLIAWDRLPAWLIGSLILALWWAIGGKYTIEGLPLLGNLVFEWFHVPVQLAPIRDGRWYAYLCWLPVIISFVERQYRPWTDRAILKRERLWLLLLWLVVIAIDAGSTYLAIRNPAPNAWTLTKQVATLAPLAVTWSLLTTFGPESGLSWLWRYLRGG